MDLLKARLLDQLWKPLEIMVLHPLTPMEVLLQLQQESMLLQTLAPDQGTSLLMLMRLLGEEEAGLELEEQGRAREAERGRSGNEEEQGRKLEAAGEPRRPLPGSSRGNNRDQGKRQEDSNCNSSSQEGVAEGDSSQSQFPIGAPPGTRWLSRTVKYKKAPPYIEFRGFVKP